MLVHVYVIGRFGPERHIGFVVADDCLCMRSTSYITFDIVKDTHIEDSFWTNPLSIANLKEYRKWKKNMEAEMSMADKAKKFMEDISKEKVVLHTERNGWFAFSNSEGKIAVVHWDVFKQEFVFCPKPSAKIMRNLDIH